jgi:hypothetical protein
VRYLIALFFFACTFLSYAQTPAENELRLKELREKKIEFHKKTDGEYYGYRVKIHFGGDKDKARAVKAAFLKKYPDVPAYEEYAQPNFTILVGDFRSKMEAYEFFKKIKYDFPNAFIVKDKIRPIKLPAQP